MLRKVLNKGMGKWVLGAMILFMLSGTAARAAEDTSLYPSIDTLNIKEEIIDELLEIWPAGLEVPDSFPILYQFSDTISHRPASDVLCVLSIGSLKKKKTSDENGEVLFWIPFADAPDKVECVVYSKVPVRAKFSMTATGGGSELFYGAGVETGEGLNELKEKEVRILYPEGYEEQAQQLMNTIKEVKKVITNITKMELKPLKIIMSEKAHKGVHVGGWAVSLEPSNTEKYTLIPHEWVEGSLLDYYGVRYSPEDEEELFPDSTINIRWIGDGIAEYVTLEICKKLNPEGGAHQSRLSYEDTTRIFDLRTWHPATLTELSGGEVGWKGYDLAPYFWAKIVEKSGNPQIIAEFLKEFRQQEDHSPQNAIAILSRLSGLNIEEELVISGKEYWENVTRYWPVKPSEEKKEE